MTNIAMRMTPALENLTVGDWMATAIDRLQEGRVDSAAILAGWLLAAVLEISRLEWPLYRAQRLSEAQSRALHAILDRALRHEPLSYILGESSFMGHHLLSDARALVPRPETERMVERVLSDTDLWARPSPVVVDVGTGSGCIVLALALARPESALIAIDVDARALELARENARHVGVADRVQFIEGDLLTDFGPDSLDGIVANLPYIRYDEKVALPESVRAYEPERALYGGADGLDLIRRLIQQSSRTLKPGGMIYLEIGETQGPAVHTLLRASGLTETRIEPDWNGRDRMAIGKKSW